MQTTEFKLKILAGSVTIYADKFGVQSMNVTNKGIIRGDVHIAGNLTVDKLRGGSAGVPVALISDSIDLRGTGVGERAMFISPINGKIHSIFVIPDGTEAAQGLTLGFYNYTGVRAASELLIGEFTDHESQGTVFDWDNIDDSTFCTVGIGTSFWALLEVSTFAVVAPYSSLCAIIQPTVSGGVYV